MRMGQFKLITWVQKSSFNSIVFWLSLYIDAAVVGVTNTFLLKFDLIIITKIYSQTKI